ncbi:phage terminase [Klebsiella pneumoniae]|nr:phage terminase [Klebsiella pneumoniae]
MKSQVDLQIPAKLVPVFATEGIRYRGAHGGRGSAKTRTFALMSAVKAYQAAESGLSGVILCAREFMNSPEESSMEEVKQAIRSVPWLDDYFDIGEKYIRTKNRNVSYVFCGLRHNLDSIKSKARILVAWVDEAESVSATAWKKLRPTVRENGSEIWVTWNPEKDGSATDKTLQKEPAEKLDDCRDELQRQSVVPGCTRRRAPRRPGKPRLRRLCVGFWEGAYLEKLRQAGAGEQIRRAEFLKTTSGRNQSACCSAPTSVSQKTRARLFACSSWITTSTSNTRPTAMV